MRLYQLWGECDLATKGLLVFAALVALNQFVQAVAGVGRLVVGLARCRRPARRKTSVKEVTCFSLSFAEVQVAGGETAETTLRTGASYLLTSIDVPDDQIYDFALVDFRVGDVSYFPPSRDGVREEASLRSLVEAVAGGQVDVGRVRLGDSLVLVVRNRSVLTTRFRPSICGLTV